MARVFSLIIVLAVLLTGGVAVWRSLHAGSKTTATSDAQSTQAPAGAMGARASAAVDDGPGCQGPAAFVDAARHNSETAQSLSWAPFGREEQGWRIYWPLVAHEIGAGCGPSTTAFAAALASWQKVHAFPADGVLTPAQFDVMKIAWYRRMYHAPGGADQGCLAAPQASAAAADPSESYGGKTIQLDPQVLEAYRRMVAAARDEVPGLKDDPQMLTIFSGFRSPAADAATCDQRGGCQGPVKSRCSNHRTGRALDIVMGAAPGQRVDSSDDANRLYMSQTAAYRWMVANADRFGFANYPFEPWHWEWTGPGGAGNTNRVALLKSSKESQP
jgi:hypothetical protein